MTIETLLLTGANNHDWARSAPFCRDLLNNTGKFTVFMTDKPSEALADRKALSKYQLFFVDYNGAAWSDTAKENFVDAIGKGAGVCILHAANNSFVGWREYEEICALVWGEGTLHGSYHKFAVKIVNPAHPITQGLPAVFENHPDELYHRLVHMHNAPYETLATAYSSPESRGTGKDEPVFIARSYGEGRVFHSILGHVWSGGAMDTFTNPDFQCLLLRGCEWAATGKVTIQYPVGKLQQEAALNA